MNSLRHITLSSLILLFSMISNPAEAQFSSNGDDPGRLRWFRMDTPAYRLIYPAGCDSLAMSYGNELERFRLSESISSGLVPGEGYRRKTPIILHTHHGISNAAVTWAPKRIDIYTLPDAYDPEPVPWTKTLAVHESRHLAQMHFGYKGWLKPLTFIVGDMAPGAYSALWPNTWFLEGDAVTAETALTSTGRGRTADFLDYYMMAFDNGDWRNWNRWRNGSYRHYAPDHYALGYLTIAGTRYCFDDPLFTERYFSRLAANPFRFSNAQKTVRQASGKSFRKSFSDIMSSFHDIWKEEAETRRPFTKAEQLQTGGKWYKTVHGNVSANGKVYSIVSGLAESAMLTEFDPETGKRRNLRTFSSTADGLSYADGKLWWSESVPDARWSLEMTSRIRSYDLATGHTGTLTRKGRLFNPSVSPDGTMLAAVEYPVTGGSAIVILNPATGKVLRRRQMPDSLQAVEPRFMSNALIFNAISEGGSAIYRINAGLDGEPECLLGPVKVSIRNLVSANDKVYFSSDRDGTQELYSIDIESRKVFQHTSLPYGGDEFCFIGQDVVFSMLTKDGRLLHKAPALEISGKEEDFNDIHQLTDNQKNTLDIKVEAVKDKFKDNQEISELADELYKNLDSYENRSKVENDLKTEIRGGKIVVYKEVKPQMTVQNYIDELAQLDAIAIPEEKLRQGLENAIDKKIIGLDKNKIDSAIDSIYSKSLLFNKKLKKILEDTPEEELLGKIPPEVLKRLKKIRGEKQDIKNRKYKLFKKPPPRESDDKPRENFDGPPYGLNPLLLRGVRVLTNQFI